MIGLDFLAEIRMWGTIGERLSPDSKVVVVSEQTARRDPGKATFRAAIAAAR